MTSTDAKINEILEKEHEKIINYLQWYEKLEGNYTGKIRINTPYLQEIQEKIKKMPRRIPHKDSIPTKRKPNRIH